QARADGGEPVRLLIRRQCATYTEYDEAHDEYAQPDFAQPALIAPGLDRTTIQPGQHEQYCNGPPHDDDAPELRVDTKEWISDGAEHRVERCEIPDWRNVIRRFQRIRRLEIGFLEEVSATLREVEYDHEKYEQEYHDRYKIMHGVVRVERKTIARNTIGILELLDIHTVGIVGTDFVQRENVQHHEPEDHDRQCHDVKCEEPVQRDPGYEVVTANPLRQVFTDHRNGAEQGDDNLCTP